MNGGFVLLVGAAQCFTVNGDNPLHDRLYGFHPSEKGLLELFRVHARKDAGKGIMGRNTVRKFQKALEPLPLRKTELLNLFPGVRPADHRTQSNCDDINELMSLI